MTLKNIHKTIIVGFGNQGKKRKKFTKNIVDIVEKNTKIKKINLTKAFQRRFRQKLINGKIDQECLLISKNLVNS